MKRLTFLLAVIASLSFLAGCGQSGPLYIPGDPSQMAVPKKAKKKTQPSRPIRNNP
jgi:predicted small lipoprotein YifL